MFFKSARLIGPGLLLILGAALLSLPDRWIEAATGFDPDLGGGYAELVAGCGLIIAGLAIGLRSAIGRTGAYPPLGAKPKTATRGAGLPSQKA